MNFDGTLQWVEDCHGDTYSTYPRDGALYVVGHMHYCGNVPGGFHQTEPWTYYFGLAFSKPATGTLKAEYFNYTNFAGTRAPSILHWFPRLTPGTFTGQDQAAWSIAGNDDYLVAGGEFPTAGGVPQQGLTRWPTRAVGPNDVGPELAFAKSIPTVTSPAPGQAVVTWQTNWDRDNENLTYKVMRNGNLATPAYTVTAASKLWDRPYLSFVDNNPTQDLVAGQSVRYRIFAVDPLGNESRSDTVNVTLATAGTPVDTYAKSVLDDGPMHYWRLSEPSGTSIGDYTGLDAMTATSGVTRGTAGAIAGDSAATFPGSGNATASNATSRPGPFWFSVEAWFNTTTNRGGKIIGYGSSRTGNSAASQSDRTIYMGNNGSLNFGVRQGSTNRVITSPGTYRNGVWHHVVGTVGDTGMNLFVDGVKVANRNDTSTGTSFNGYWRVGGDTLSGWTNRPTSDYFAGAIDDVAVYRQPLTANRIRNHYVTSGRVVAGTPVPTDAYGLNVYNDGPESFWRFGETSGTTAADSSQNGQTAGYVNGAVLGGASAIGLAGDRSVTFDGVNDGVAANIAVQNPNVYSEEIWFKTNTIRGGKLIGFGSSRTGNSSSFDRHIFMTNAGKLRFGVYTTGESTIETSASYNDNAWHQVVATQGKNGMNLYVDGLLVGSNPQVSAQQYTGYWRVGGDSLSSWASRPTSDWFAGSLDEPAVYPRVLTAAQVRSHYLAGGGSLTNVLPTAAFTSSPTDLTVAFDSSGSTDPDGTIASYAWNFGDGGTSTAANPNHTYPATGTYTVTLTVTDDRGGIATVSHDVSVLAVNVVPTAAFTSTVDFLDVDFDSSGSSDSDGTIDSYAWTFGDGGTSSAANPSHTYAAEGSYNVTLTVTDNRGGTGTVSHSVTAINPPPIGIFAEDDFGRSVTNGFGSAGSGGPWTLNGTASLFQVNNGSGAITMNAAGAGPRASLTSVPATDSDATVTASLNKIANGGGAFVSLGSRVIGNNSYRVKVKVDANGRVTVYLMRVDAAETTLTSVLLPAATLTYAAGDKLQIRLQTEGTSPTALRARVWKVGTTEPSTWQVETTDNTASFQNPGGFTLATYLAGSATNAPVVARFDDLFVSVIGGPPPANIPPTAAFSSEVDHLEASFDSSGSQDTDGTIASYAWDFGDGGTSTAANPNHTYASGGTWDVSLTVTDDDGSSDSITHQVTSSVPPPAVLASDDFERTVVNGFGTSVSGGPWSLNGTASLFQVNNGSGAISMNTPGGGPRATLGTVSATDSDATVRVSLDKVANGGGAYVSLGSRVIGNNSYRTKVKVDAAGRVTVYLMRVDPAEVTLASLSAAARDDVCRRRPAQHPHADPGHQLRPRCGHGSGRLARPNRQPGRSRRPTAQPRSRTPAGSPWSRT